MKFLFYFPSIYAFVLYSNLYFKGLILKHSIWHHADFIENIIFSSILLLIINLFENKRIKKVLSLFFLFIINILTLTEISITVLYKSFFTPPVLFILMDSNQNEAYEYLQSNISSVVIILSSIVILLIPIIINTKYPIDNFLKKYIHPVFLKKTLTVFTIIILTLSIKYSLLKYNLPYQIVTSYLSYKKNIQKNKAFETPYGNFNNITRNYKTDKNREIHIIIIGESTTRHHMGIYDYIRNTNPLLFQRNDIISFDNVISPHAYTLKSLEKILTLSNYEHPENKHKGTIIQLANKVGFKTYWLSNQGITRKNDMQTSIIARAAHTSKFINFSISNKYEHYDEELLPILKNILNKKEAKQFIFIHLIGSHTQYINRYPSTFTIYNTSDSLSRKARIINSYDNSIVYNDFIVNQIINLTENEDAESFIVYFSDHGEDVYESENRLLSHSENIGTKPMFDIPFIIWFSQKYINKNHNRLKIDIHRPYMLDDLIFSIGDLLNLKFSLYDERRSIFSNNFINRKRIILNNIDYDIKYQQPK
jgi:heptose-I-phosphate ethanolaminephosphotransferase